jgi:hypothetical protein
VVVVNRAYPAGTLLVLILLLAGSACGYESARKLRIRKVDASRAPQIEGKRVQYSLMLEFDSVPRHCWIFRDPRRADLVLDCYGVEVSGPEKKAVPRESPFGELEVENLETNLSLSGRQARIRIELRDTWHYDQRTIGNSAIEIVVWKELSPIRNRRRVRWTPILAGVVAALGTTVLTLLLIQAHDGRN